MPPVWKHFQKGPSRFHPLQSRRGGLRRHSLRLRLLLRSGLRNEHIGRNLHLHPVSNVCGVFDEDIRPWEGTMQAIYSDEHRSLTGNYGVKYETTALQPVIAMALCLGATPRSTVLFRAAFEHCRHRRSAARSRRRRASPSTRRVIPLRTMRFRDSIAVICATVHLRRAHSGSRRSAHHIFAARQMVRIRTGPQWLARILYSIHGFRRMGFRPRRAFFVSHHGHARGWATRRKLPRPIPMAKPGRPAISS